MHRRQRLQLSGSGGEKRPSVIPSFTIQSYTMIVVLALLAGLLLAYANGSNDNFKGVATLYGSGTTSHRHALIWATLTTAAGSLAAVWFAGELLARFSGKGIVSEELTSQGTFGVAVATSAAITVQLASRLGIPISTTHALVGSMVGASAAVQSAVHWQVLGVNVLVPLFFSPIIAIVATALVYMLFRNSRMALGVEKETCLCVGCEVIDVLPAAHHSLAVVQASELSVSMGTRVTCRERYAGRLVGFDARQLLDTLHFLSAGLVSFARGLNDTPKIAGLMLLVPAFSSTSAILFCGVAIALGGIISGRRIAKTLSHAITPMNPGQGFSANLVTSFLVIGATRWGMPVSTTHVSCGALFGIGSVNGQAHWQVIGRILLAWVTTLPLAALLAAAILWLLRGTL